jgi:hypothetical protein
VVRLWKKVDFEVEGSLERGMFHCLCNVEFLMSIDVFVSTWLYIYFTCTVSIHVLYLQCMPITWRSSGTTLENTTRTNAEATTQNPNRNIRSPDHRGSQTISRSMEVCTLRKFGHYDI